jgi:hypothetical protein
VAFLGGSRGSPRWQGKQEVALSDVQSLHAAAPCLRQEDKATLHIAPWLCRFFREIQNNTCFCRFEVPQVQKVVKSIRAFLLINKAQLVFILIFSNRSNPFGTLCREFDIWAN